MSPDFLTGFLASILHEQGVSDPQRVAAKVAADLRKAKAVDLDAVKREQIRRDPSRDYRVLIVRYHCSPQTVYRAWAEILPARETE